VVAGVSPTPAAADYYITPFLGMKFGGETTLVDPEAAIGTRKWIVGGSFSVLSDGILGVEADYTLYPGFLQREHPRPILSSSYVQSITGALILAAPLSFTRESLRPYVVAGVGWMGVQSTDVADIDALAVDSDMVALNLGAGAIGMLGDRFGLRFDIRRLSNIDHDPPTGDSLGTERLSFWRTSVGVTIRY
jgi:hypothetical protein